MPERRGAGYSSLEEETLGQWLQTCDKHATVGCCITKALKGSPSLLEAKE